MRTVSDVNESINSKYDRITILVPKGTADLINNLVIDANLATDANCMKNRSAYIRALIEADYCGCVDWEGYEESEDYGILLRVAERKGAPPITDYRAKLR